jgi:uncharacterized protein (DUF58 family)
MRWWQQQKHAWRASFARKLGTRAGRSLPIVLQQRQLYVLPTRFGFGLAGMLFVCVLGALNYNNNLALAFAFVFSALAFLSVHVAHSNMMRLRIEACTPTSAHAGQRAMIGYRLDPVSGERSCLRGYLASEHETEFELVGAERIAFALPADARGWLEVPPLTLSTQWPFGLFEVWTYVWPDEKVLIYPRLEASPPGFPEQDAAAEGEQTQSGQEDLRYLRAYRHGDSPRRIAWKVSARVGQLLLKETESPRQEELVLDYSAITELDHEAKLSRLASWSVLAHQRGYSFALKLPSADIEMGQGDAHLETCLRALGQAP